MKRSNPEQGPESVKALSELEERRLLAQQDHKIPTAIDDANKLSRRQKFINWWNELNLANYP